MIAPTNDSPAGRVVKSPLLRVRTVFRSVFLCLFVIVLAFGAWLGWQWLDALPEGLTAEYVGRGKCVECHPDEDEKWQGSHHDLAMDHATPDTVLADFDDTTFECNGVTSRFFRKDGKYWVHTEGREGKMETFELPYVFGVNPLQQYLAKFPGGRYQALPISWDVNKKEWFHLYEKEKVEPDEWLYWTNRGMNWNYMCADCHSTNLQKNYDPQSDTYHTTWSEINVSCEACHGAASLHLKIVERGKIFWDRRYGTGLAYLKNPDNQMMIDTCGKCHARRQVGHPGFEPGDDFLDFYSPELLDTQSYYADGQILEEDYVYSSFHLSLMYQNNVRCTDCHDPHSVRILAQDNQLCTRCHLAGKYDTPSHHFHKPEDDGSLCVMCHMPETTYMCIDPRRDHSFRIPRPDLTLSLKIPNACNRCHTDQTPEWSQEYVVKWYGEKQWPRRLNFAATIAGGRQGDLEVERELTRLARDSRQAAFLRSAAVALLRNYPLEKTVTTLKESLGEQHPLLRLYAVRNLERALFPASQGLATLGRAGSIDHQLMTAIARLLDDPSALVRSEAARVLAGVPRSELPSQETAEAFDRELQAYIDSMIFSSDDPGPNHNLANLYAAMGDNAKAEEYFELALARDPSFNAARFNLAMLYYESGRAKQARVAFQEVIRWARRQTRIDDPVVVQANKSLMSQAHYSLGLLIAEDPAEYPSAVSHFEKALELDPERHRIRYNLALAYQHLDRDGEAERLLQEAYRAQPLNDDYAYALAVFYAQRGKPDVAREILRAVVYRNPRHANATLLMRQLGAGQSSGTP